MKIQCTKSGPCKLFPIHFSSNTMTIQNENIIYMSILLIIVCTLPEAAFCTHDGQRLLLNTVDICPNTEDLEVFEL